MLILRLIRYLRGYVRFKATGVFVERFLNLVAREHIPLWDGRKKGDTYTGSTIAAHYHRLRRPARKAGVSLRVAEKRGAPFEKKKYRKRKGLLGGLLLFAAFMFIVSQFIWRIDVAVNPHVDESRVRQALDKLGIGVGTLRSSIDVRDAERKLLLELDEVSWIALNIDGSAIHVELNDTTPPPENFVDVNTPCNIVASHSGQIITMRVYDGQAVVQQGQAVEAGDILVSGIMQDRHYQNIFRHSLADIIAQVQITETVRVPMNQTEYKPTGETKVRRYLQFPKLDLPLFIPLKLPQPYAVERQKVPFSFFGMPLPIGYLREDYILMEEVPVTLTEEQAKAQALEQLNLIQKTRLADAEILDKKAVGKIQDDTLIVDATYICNMNIAMEKAILAPEDTQIESK
ncbi:sporulation protein YqfD [Oscillospiraceae bacterium MB08-C2-2]|nr:sporulation protein YqfD [Oscillospiraceae bacterium MB08-C2-2]